MKKSTSLNISLSIVSVVIGSAFVFLASYVLTPANNSAYAANASNWQAGNIIADGVFYNGGDLTVDQIQQFMNQKIADAGGCDTNGTRTSELGGGTRAQFGTSRGYAPPYTCINQYYESPTTHANNLSGQPIPSDGQSAAQIIKNAATTYNVSARALLVIIQKESPGPLLTDTWPLPNQYTNALGYGCPDTAPCDSQYAGFMNQVTNAARQFQLYKTNASNYRNKSQSTNAVLYNPNSSCGSSSVFISSNATAGLYNYTPYQPNQAALSNLYGSGDGCSAYGNRNFWRMFTDWFGSTQMTSPYAWTASGNPSYVDAARTKQFTGSAINLLPGQSGYITVSALNAGSQTWTQDVVHLGTAAPNDRNSPFADSSWLSSGRIKMAETSVVPGDKATFTFSIKAPAAPGTYYERLSVVADGITWMNDPGLVFTINVVNHQAVSNNLNTGLNVNQSVTGQQNLLSPDAQTLLRIQDGDIRIYSNYQLVWRSNTAGSVSGLYMQSDGNLVLYSTTGQPLWNTATSGNPGAHLVMQTDGNLVVYSATGTPLWSTGTVSFPDHLSRVDYTLANAALYPGQSLLTPDGKRRMVLQPDGNLVVYSNGNAVWASGTSGQSVKLLAMQPDGNLVIYSTDGNALWTSKTSGNGASVLAMQSDGNLVIYSPSGTATWNTATSGR